MHIEQTLAPRGTFACFFQIISPADVVHMPAVLSDSSEPKFVSFGGQWLETQREVDSGCFPSSSFTLQESLAIRFFRNNQTT